VSFFAVVMGLAGLSIATHRLETSLALGHAASIAITVAAAAAFLFIAALYAIKLIRHPQAVIAEWRHPVRLNFFPAISISLLLLAITALPLSITLAAVLWSIGAALHLYATLSVVAAWISHRAFEPLHLNPAWFIPAVGNVVVPIAGVPLGFTEVSWFFFSIGVLFWLVLMTLVFNRLIFHNPLPERLLPTLMILVAPPAVAFLSYLRLTGGMIDGLARVLFYAAAGLLLVVATQAARLAQLPFALSWWAYSFPLAAVTTAFAVYAERIGGAFLQFAFLGLYGILSIVIVILAYNTVVAIRRRHICRPEP
jgi:tellurite resistance protein